MSRYFLLIIIRVFIPKPWTIYCYYSVKFINISLLTLICIIFQLVSYLPWWSLASLHCCDWRGNTSYLLCLDCTFESLKFLYIIRGSYIESDSLLRGARDHLCLKFPSDLCAVVHQEHLSSKMPYCTLSIPLLTVVQNNFPLSFCMFKSPLYILISSFMFLFLYFSKRVIMLICHHSLRYHPRYKLF